MFTLVYSVCGRTREEPMETHLSDMATTRSSMSVCCFKVPILDNRRLFH